MVATAIYSLTIVLWKETAFSLCRATELMEMRWERNVVSLVSSIIIIIIFLFFIFYIFFYYYYFGTE